MEQEATRPQQKAGGKKRVGDSPGATAGSATPDSAQYKDKLSRDAPGAGKGVGNPRPTIRILEAPTAASLTNLPGGGGVNPTSAAQAGAAALHAADFPLLQKAAQSGKSKAASGLKSGSDDENELSDSVASSTGLSKVSKPTAHCATKSSHRNMKAEEPARVGVVVSVGTEGISIPGISIPNRPMMDPERPPSDHRSWRVAQNIRRCRLILLCSQPRAINSAALETVKETHKDGAGAREPSPGSATGGSTAQSAGPGHGSAWNKMNQHNQGAGEGARSDQSLFGADERPPPPIWKTEAELRKRTREADARAEQRAVQRLMNSPDRGKPCTLLQHGKCSRRGRGEQGERMQCNRKHDVVVVCNLGRRKRRKHDGWRTYECASSKDETFVCTWDNTACPYDGHVARGDG